MPLDYSSFTGARARIGLYATQKWNKATVGFPGEIREFTARALTDGVPLSRLKMLQYGGASTRSVTGSAADARISRYALKAIITGDANGNILPFVENPHSFLVDPCSLGTTPNLGTSLSLIKMFPTFITSDEYDISSGMIIGKDDTIKVTLTVGGDGALNMTQGQILSIVAVADPAQQKFESCDNLQGQFAINTIELLEVATSPMEIDASVCEEGYSEFYLMHPLMNGSYPITSDYGMRIHPVTKKKKMHEGTDFGAREGTPIYAAADGVIDGIYSSTGGGNTVRIKHTGVGSAYKTKYLHMVEKPTHIKNGDPVAQGDLIGKVGETGRVTGPHLHLELWKGSAHLDSAPFIKTIQKCGVTETPPVASTDPTSPAGTDADEGPIVEG